MAEFLQLMESWDGQVPLGSTSVDESKVAKLIDLLANKDRRPRNQHEYLLKEVITTSDFPTLFGVAIDREMLANWRANLGDWRAYTKVARLPNFNRHERHKVYGNDNLLPRVVEKGEYLVADVGTGAYYNQVRKYGRQFDISWESLINDSMGAFSDLAVRFATAAQRTVARTATGLYSSATGPNALLYGAPIADVDGQNVTNLGVLPLTIANLQTTLGLMAAQTDPNGEPISVRGVHLVVPTALEFQARSILTSALQQWTEVGAGGGIPVPTTNIVPQLGIQLHVDPYLSVVDVTAAGVTTWYVFAEPSQGAAIEMAFLSGYEDPEICMKASDKVALGSFAGMSPFSGDFATDNVFYRVRLVVGGTQLDPRYTYAQDPG